MTTDDFCVAWRTALRRIWRLPRNSYSILVPLIADCRPLYDCICRRTIKFVASCLTSDSPLVRTVVHYGVSTARASSIVGRNMYTCALRYGVSCETLMIASSDGANLYDQFVHSHLSLDDRDRVNCALELISVRDGALTLSGFSPDEVDKMLSLLLTD